MLLRHLRQFTPIALALSLILNASASAQEKEEPPIFGWLELAKFINWPVVAKVKMDTGALSSSLHATNLEYFQRDNAKWVRFTVEIEDQKDQKEKVQEIFEEPVYRFVTITSSNGESDRRPSVLMKLCLGGEIYEEQFTLNDRSDLTYPVLLGRRTIEHLGLIDVTRIFTSRPQCSDKAPVHTIENRELDEDIGI
ncbi:ATP-dependent zinc protease family protein [Nitrosococcus oceani]|uniref:Retropepsin-like aspartic endopeptidase domain-containing protein n=2 Tax=Nitrosococcus oceani TaxID=1229 RepID=Q3JDJ7_NITOC|nr:ATP-dependent zinc protease [Nitrosococcus oceani]KFI20460.1 hypothetical protein IB75_03075 [Nitrosococcus oceani C-27]ABA57099.1 Protein of unknown function DUF785 [Nitrosococcus oceani ATCC 19707]EDZ65648.1 conserved hypothetical protein [Nitrosococcus oceani AFC27]KFI23575.1 hypothetical protein HW44_03100 [Nitrosococcus oceani]GEM19881.1 ATP-dependent zinc protease [Nitrosococcus oceani]